MTVETLTNSAQKWADLGLKIVPVNLKLVPNGKKAVTCFWKWKTSYYPKFENLNWVGANGFAVMLGETPHGWLVCVDGDHDLGHDAYSALTKEFPDLCSTYVERSPHGFHFFLSIDKPIDAVNINIKTMNGLELHVNGLIFMAPTSYEGGKYEVYNNAEILRVPDFYQQFQRNFGIEPTNVDVSSILKGVSEGERNEATIRLTSWYRRRQGLSKEETKQKLLEWNKKNTAPLSTQELLSVLDSAYRNIEPYNYFFVHEPNEAHKAKKIEGTVGTKIGNYRLKKRGKKVFLFDEDGKPVDSCKLDSVDGPRFKKQIQEATGLSEKEINRATATFQYALQSIKKGGGEIEEHEKSEEEEFDEETKNKAWELLKDPAFFYKVGKVFEHGFVVPKLHNPRFIIGEERNKRLLGFLLIGASKLSMTSLTKLLGGPATAKDAMLRMWLALLPIKSVERSYFTAAGLRYSKSMKNADLLYIPDSPSLRGEMGRQMRFMRADDGGLISEYATRDAETGEMVTKISRLPVKGIATTSNVITGDTALESGMWTLRTNGSPDLTRKVKEEKLKLRAGNRPLFPEDELKAWRCAFKILISEELPSALPVVPYAERLINLLESERSESRRDPDKLCDLISLIAWTRRFQKDPSERDEADLTDFFLALQVGLDAITETISELDEKEQRIMEAVKERTIGESSISVTCRQVTDETKIPYETCYRYLERLVEKGFLNKGKEKGRNIYSILHETSKQLFISGMKSSKNPKELIELVLKSFEGSSALHEGREVSFINPLNGSEVEIRGRSKVTFEDKEYLYPYEDLERSERSEETPSETKKESKQVSITGIKREKPLDSSGTQKSAELLEKPVGGRIDKIFEQPKKTVPFFPDFQDGPYLLSPEKYSKGHCAGCKKNNIQRNYYYNDKAGNPRKICEECYHWKLEKQEQGLD